MTHKSMYQYIEELLFFNHISKLYEARLVNDEKRALFAGSRPRARDLGIMASPHYSLNLFLYFSLKIGWFLSQTPLSRWQACVMRGTNEISLRT
jgi:hypothetical protein